MVRSELLAARLALGFRTLLSSLPLLHGVDRPHGLCDGQPFSLFGRLAFASICHGAEHDLFRSDVGGRCWRLARAAVAHALVSIVVRCCSRLHLEMIEKAGRADAQGSQPRRPHRMARASAR